MDLYFVYLYGYIFLYTYNFLYVYVFAYIQIFIYIYIYKKSDIKILVNKILVAVLKFLVKLQQQLSASICFLNCKYELK